MSDAGRTRHCPLCLAKIEQARTMLINASPGSFEGRAGYVAICPSCARQNMSRIVLFALVAGVCLLLLVFVMMVGGERGSFDALDAATPGGLGALLAVCLASFSALIVVGVNLGHLRFRRMLKRLANARANSCHVDRASRRRGIVKAICNTMFACALAVPVIGLALSGTQALSKNPSGYVKTVYRGSVQVSQGTAGWSDVNSGLALVITLVAIGGCIALLGFGIGAYCAALRPAHEEAKLLLVAFPSPPEVFMDRSEARDGVRNRRGLGGSMVS